MVQRLINSLTDLVCLFYPILCVSCDNHLNYGEKILCVSCKHQLPFTYYNLNKNPVQQLFYGRFPLELAFSLLLFKEGNLTQSLMHELKYQGNEEIGEMLADLLSVKIKKTFVEKGITAIVPVPLHPLKLQKRGYNQLTKFGMQLSKSLSVPFLQDVLLREKIRQTQTKKNKSERIENTVTLFKLEKAHEVENKHVLLIDDVITTGATLEACAKEILKADGVRLSIATMAYTV